jgi:hypothetical protein
VEDGEHGDATRQDAFEALQRFVIAVIGRYGLAFV